MGRRTFDFPSALAGDTVCGGAEVGGGGDEVECIFVVLVERDRLLASTQPRGKAFSTATIMYQPSLIPLTRGDVHTSQQKALGYPVASVHADPSVWHH